MHQSPETCTGDTGDTGDDGDAGDAGDVFSTPKACRFPQCSKPLCSKCGESLRDAREVRDDRGQSN